MNKTVVTLLAALVALSALAQGTTNLNLNWNTFDGGGGTSSNSFGRLRGTIGQPDSGQMTAGTFALVGGFWAVAAIQTPGAPWLAVSLTTTNTVVVSWPLPDTGWKLQATANPAAKSVVWTEITPPYATGATCLYYVEPIPAGPRYYRLHKP